LQQEMANKTIVILKSQAKLDKKGNRKKNQHNHRCNFIEQQFKNIVSDKGIAKWTKMMTMDGKNRGVCEGTKSAWSAHFLAHSGLKYYKYITQKICIGECRIEWRTIRFLNVTLPKN